MENLKSKIPILVLALAVLHCLSFSWLKWGDVLVDVGRDLDIARQIAEGRALYSQVRYFYGPFAPLLNGLLFELCGVHLTVFAATGILVALLSCGLLYRLARLSCGRLGSTSIAAAFLYICAFGHLAPNGIFNFVLPYTTAATYGMCSALASVFFLLRHARKAKRLDLLLSLVFLALVALTKIEILFTTALAHLAFIGCGLWMKRLSWRLHLCGYAAAVLAVAGVYSVFIHWAGLECVVHDNLLVLLSQPFAHFSREKMGVASPAESLASMAYSALAAASVCALAYVAGKLAEQRQKAKDERPKEKDQGRITGRAVASFVFPLSSLAFALACGAGVYAFLSLELPFRLLPALCAGMLLHLLWRWRREPAERPGLWLELILWVFALGSISRLGLRVVSYHYGFYLLPAGLLVFGLLWFTYLPRWLERKGTDPDSRSVPIFSAAGLGVLCALAWSHYSLSNRMYGLHTFDLDAPRGHMLLLDNLRGLRTGQYYATVVQRLSLMPPHTRVIVVPQGVGLAFLSGRDNPYGTCGYLITDVAGSYSDERLLELLKSQPPELVVHAASDTSEVGPQVFGKDYAVKSWAWIRENYQPVIEIGKPAFAVIYCRKGVDFSPMLESGHRVSAPSGEVKETASWQWTGSPDHPITRWPDLNTFL